MSSQSPDINQLFPLKGKVALITGGSRGIDYSCFNLMPGNVLLVFKTKS